MRKGIVLSRILIGNILGLAASALMVYIGVIKKHKRIILAQCIDNGIFAFANFVLGGTSAVIINILTVIRNVICYKWKLTIPLKCVFTVLQIGIPVLFGGGSIIYWFPVIAGCLLTWVLDNENVIVLKSVLALVQLLWAIFDFSVMNYTTMAFDVFAVFSNVCSILSILREREKETGVSE